MMTRHILTAFFLVLMLSTPAFATPVIGEPAPAFTGTDATGTQINLSDYLGKTVVLEWTNHECPYVQKHYGTNNMQTLQQEATDKGVIWLTVVSSATGKQGATTPEEALSIMEEVGSHETARILDPEGTIGTLYEAKTSPHMFVINAEGTLIYMGAIDDAPSAKPETVENAKNYVQAALNALENGTLPETSATQPYGCSVKY